MTDLITLRMPPLDIQRSEKTFELVLLESPNDSIVKSIAQDMSDRCKAELLHIGHNDVASAIASHLGQSTRKWALYMQSGLQFFQLAMLGTFKAAGFDFVYLFPTRMGERIMTTPSRLRSARELAEHLVEQCGTLYAAAFRQWPETERFLQFLGASFDFKMTQRASFEHCVIYRFGERQE